MIGIIRWVKRKERRLISRIICRDGKFKVFGMRGIVVRECYGPVIILDRLPHTDQGAMGIVITPREPCQSVRNANQ